MSMFASRRNTRTEEQVIVKELCELLDAREVPSDPIRRAQFWADFYRTGLTEPRADVGSGSDTQRKSGAPVRGSASPVQDPLFTEEVA